jgi:threonyl-tRNA synthetase
MLYKIYGDFGFNEVIVKLSTRPAKRIGSDAEWDRAETSLANALKLNNLEFEYQPGEGAFYGPKIEFTLKDSLGRLWQCGTIQLDSNLPERLGAEYVAEDNSRKRPLMLHRAIVGSMERFLGILIEHYAGAMPAWLAPMQAMVLNISDGQSEYVSQVVTQLKKSGFRVDSDLRNEKITYKIREHSLQKLPYLLIAGEREMQSGQVAVRTRKGEDLGSMSLDAFIQLLKNDVDSKV